MTQPILHANADARLAAMNRRFNDELALTGAFEIYRHTQNAEERAMVLATVRPILRGLLDAAYGPVRGSSAVHEITSWTAVRS